MHRQSIGINYLKTISWLNDKIVDWASAGTAYSLDGKVEELNKYHFAFDFDSAITSLDGQYTFIYKRFGTKGLLLKNGEELREINRSYYHANSYEYPAAFITLPDHTTFLVHCPISYCRLDFENVETGEIVTNTPNRKPEDIFHSRLEVSPDNKYLISKGWVWQPWYVVELFDVAACLMEPCLLDSGQSIPDNSTEICSASFIDNDKILVCASQEDTLNNDSQDSVPPGHIAIWDFKANEIFNAIHVKEEFGNIIAIDEKHCWDLYNFPKIINLQTGEIIDKIEDLHTGLQRSAIRHHGDEKLPLIAYNRQLKALAIKNEAKIEIIWGS